MLEYVLIWWGAWFALLLTWYSREMKAGRREPLHWKIALAIFFLSGLLPVIAILHIIKKAFRG